MKWWSASVALFCLLACKDPNSFQPFDPTKPDPPAPPALTYPADGWMSDDYHYPQDVNLVWQPVSGAEFYGIEVYADSLLRFPGYENRRVTQTSLTVSFGQGWHYWRVRAASRTWNDYTDWSSTFRFQLPFLTSTSAAVPRHRP
jgi:hypothetical protein